MNQLFNFFIKGLIIMFLVVFGLFLLGRIKQILTWLLTLWIILALFAFLVVPAGLIWVLAKLT